MHFWSTNVSSDFQSAKQVQRGQSLDPMRFFATLNSDQSGQLSILSLVILLGMITTLAAFANISGVLRVKMETQNAADGVASTAGTHAARGMNAITATNHLIGELQALVVLHHALGGDALDNSSRREQTPTGVRNTLSSTWQLANAWCFDVPRYLRPQRSFHNHVSKRIVVQAAIRDSRVHLKKVTSYAYMVHAMGGMIFKLRYIPYVGSVFGGFGGVVMGCSLAFEAKATLEWRILDVVEFLARAPRPLKKLLRDAAIPGFHAYARLQAFATPLRAENAAREVGSQHLVEGTLFPGVTRNFSLPVLQLPVEAEPQKMNSKQIFKSQLVRASTPWIQYWRLPFLRFGERALHLARFKAWYVKHTQEMTLQLAVRARDRQGIRLLVLKGLAQVEMNKGKESWARKSGSREADRHFGIMGFAHRPAPPLAAPGWFDSVNADGVACYAQTMIYNANSARESKSELLQAEAPWDTLNWHRVRVPEWRAGQDPNPSEDTLSSRYARFAPRPEIHVNWQSMLVPSTRVAESVLWQRGALGRIMRKTAVEAPLSRTH
ncbi:MAG: hypothetical protein RLZZ232_3113 [Planctomycetota bacterium]